MYKLAVVVCALTVALAQDLDSILQDIYGPDMNTNMIHKNSAEMETVGKADTDYAHPISIKLMRRQASTEGGESCTMGKLVGRCVPYYLCTDKQQEKLFDITSSDTCTNVVEVCCAQ